MRDYGAWYKSATQETWALSRETNYPQSNNFYFLFIYFSIKGCAIGSLQPLADGLKVFIKALLLPSNSNNFIFLFSPLFIFVLNFAA